MKQKNDEDIHSRNTITAMHSNLTDLKEEKLRGIQKLTALLGETIDLIKDMEKLRDTLANELKEEAKAALAESKERRAAKNGLLIETIRAFANEILNPINTDMVDSENDSVDSKKINRIIKEIEGLEEKKSGLQALKSKLTTQPNSDSFPPNILLGGELLPISATITSNRVYGAAVILVAIGGFIIPIPGAHCIGAGIIVTGLLIMAAVMLYVYLSQKNNDTHASSTALHP